LIGADSFPRISNPRFPSASRAFDVALPDRRASFSSFVFSMPYLIRANWTGDHTRSGPFRSDSLQASTCSLCPATPTSAASIWRAYEAKCRIRPAKAPTASPGCARLTHPWTSKLRLVPYQHVGEAGQTQLSETKFATDSAREGSGFEPSVPLRDRNRIARNRGSHDSSLEGTGFEPSVPPRKRRPWREAPRPTIVVP